MPHPGYMASFKNCFSILGWLNVLDVFANDHLSKHGTVGSSTAGCNVDIFPVFS